MATPEYITLHNPFQCFSPGNNRHKPGLSFNATIESRRAHPDRSTPDQRSTRGTLNDGFPDDASRLGRETKAEFIGNSPAPAWVADEHRRQSDLQKIRLGIKNQPLTARAGAGRLEIGQANGLRQIDTCREVINYPDSPDR